MRKFVQLKDVTVAVDSIVAFGQGVYEEEKLYILSIWLEGVSNPIVSLYETAEERDNNYNLMIECIDGANKVR